MEWHDWLALGSLVMIVGSLSLTLWLHNRNQRLAKARWIAEKDIRDNPPPGCLTIDVICGAIRFYFPMILEDSLQGNRLTLHGAAGDEVMRAIFEKVGGKIIIEINEVPQEVISRTMVEANPYVAPVVNGIAFGAKPR